MRLLTSTSLALVMLFSASSFAKGSSDDSVSQIETMDILLKLVKPNRVDDYLKELYLENGITENGTNLCETLNTKNHEVLFKETEARLSDLAKFSSNFVSFYREKLAKSHSNISFPSKQIEIVIRPMCSTIVGGNALGIDAAASFDTNRIVFRMETAENEASAHYRNAVANNTTVLAHELGHLLHFSMGIDYKPINEGLADFFAYLYTGSSYAGFYPSGNGYKHVRDFQITSLKNLNSLKKGKYSFITNELQGVDAGHLAGGPLRDALIRISQKYSPQLAFDFVVYLGNVVTSKQIKIISERIANWESREKFLDEQYRAIISEGLKDFDF